MRKLLFTLLVFAAGTSAWAQDNQADGPILQFEKTHHDFGTIKEDDGPVTCTFKFKNTGSKPLTLSNVQPACGCTTPEWTKTPVDPGKEGYVKATYDVNHRPGPFNKSVTVYSNANPNIALLTFSGNVLPHVKTMEDSFPTVSGNLRFENNSLNFNQLFNNQKDTSMDLFVYNTSNSPISVKEIKNNGNYISGKNLPLVIPPKGKVRIPVHYSAALVKDYGLVWDQAKLVTNDPNLPEKDFSVIAEIHQFVPNMTDAEKAKAAKIVFPETSHDFGNVKQGDVVNTEFKFTNKGKTNLTIYKVKTTCGCTASSPEKSMIKPGETSSIKVSFNSAGKHGKEEKHITVYTNDPMNPEAGLKIIANVTDEDVK